MNNAYFRRATMNVLNGSASSFSEQSINRAFIQHQQRQHAKATAYQQSTNDESRNKDSH